MAVKTITIDLEAYAALARRKRTGQSFSDVIKERFAPKGTGRDVLEAVREFALEEDTLSAVASEVRGRQRHKAGAPQL